MPRITIIGLGVIGGSLGLALKEALGSRVEVAGHDTGGEALRQAQSLGAIDLAAPTVEEAVSGAPLVVVATPVLAMREVFHQMAPHLAEGSMVTDTGSTKAQVLRWADELLPRHAAFVGGHPMAGRETPGIAAADGRLFRGCTYCITAPGEGSARATEVVASLAASVGAHPHLMEPALHDRYVAAVSHLPILLSTALVATASKDGAWPEMSRLAATGFRDVSRLASGDPVMHRDICLTNAEAITAWLDRLVQELDTLRRLVRAGQNGGQGLLECLSAARQARDGWLEELRRRGPSEDPAQAALRLLAFLNHPSGRHS